MSLLSMTDIQVALPQILQTRSVASEPEPFFDSVYSAQMIITERQAKSQLKRVIIRDIPPHLSEYMFWRFNLEQTVRGLAPVQGLKVVDSVLLALREDVLTIFLIELKQSLSSMYGPSGVLIKPRSSLWHVRAQIEDSISRIYFLLPMLIACHERLAAAKIRFTGVICYNDAKESLSEQDLNDTEIGALWQILRQEQDVFLCQSILRQEVIPVKFFKNPHRATQPDTFETTFDDLNKQPEIKTTL